VARGERAAEAREWVARAFTRAEDVVYVALGVLLAASAVALLISAAVTFVRTVAGGEIVGGLVGILDQLLLVLMIVEILYTVQISFREHALMPEPFLVVGLIAGIRRVLVITAELSNVAQRDPETFRHAMLELGLLTVMILALVAALGIVRRRAPGAVAEKA
jgi:phosphate starvation-inducible membrane PsiE